MSVAGVDDRDKAPARLVIFDFDGVIADSETIALEELAGEMTLRGAPVDYEGARSRFLGASTAQHMRYIEQVSGRPCAPDFPDIWHERLYRRYRRELRPVEGAIGTLDWLAARGLRFCIASGGAPKRIATALEVLGLAARFHGVAFSADMVAHGKPAPDLFLLAAARMGAAPADCIVVEDATAGVLGACAAGMSAIGFVGGSHLQRMETAQAEQLKQAGARDVARTHADIRALISAWSGHQGPA